MVFAELFVAFVVVLGLFGIGYATGGNAKEEKYKLLVNNLQKETERLTMDLDQRISEVKYLEKLKR